MPKISDDDIIMEIYRRLFAEATPQGDIDAMIASGETKQDGFYRNYVLSMKRQDAIIEDVLKKHKVPKWRRSAYRNTIILGASPVYEPVPNETDETVP